MTREALSERPKVAGTCTPVQVTRVRTGFLTCPYSVLRVSSYTDSISVL